MRLSVVITVLFLILPGPSPAAAPIKVGFLVGISGMGDQSFNDMTYAGLVKAKQDFGIKLLLEDSEKNPSAFESAIKRLLKRDTAVVVAAGFYFEALIKKYAPLYPDRYFIIHDTGIEKLPNVASTIFAVNEGSFLAGALSAMMTRSTKIGFIGGVNLPIMHVFRLGFAEGVHYINPAIQLQEHFVSKGSDFSGFNNPAKGYRLAMELYGHGVDVIYCAAGLTGNGVMQAAKKMGRFAVGVDSDQDHLAPGYVLTSMMKRLDRATHIEVAEIIEGRFKPGIKHYGLKEGGVGLSPMKYTHHLIPERVTARLQQTEAKIVAGDIRVSNYLETHAGDLK